MQFLVAIYEENNEIYASLGLTVEECRAIIADTIMKARIVWEQENLRKEKRRIHCFRTILLPRHVEQADPLGMAQKRF